MPHGVFVRIRFAFLLESTSQPNQLLHIRDHQLAALPALGVAEFGLSPAPLAGLVLLAGFEGVHDVCGISETWPLLFRSNHIKSWYGLILKTICAVDVY